MMRTTCVRVMLAAVIVIGVAAMVAAQPPGGGGMGQQGGQGMRQGMGPGGPGGPGGNPMGALKLTPDQREKVQAIQQAQRAANQENGDQLRGLNERLRATLFGEHPDLAIGVATEIAQLEAQLLPSRVAMQIEIVKLLTPDQKKIAMELNLFGPNGAMGGQKGPGMRGGRGGQEPIKK